MKARLVRWRAKDVHPPGASLDKFWDDPEPTVAADGSAKKPVRVFGGPGLGFEYVTAFGIEVAGEDVFAQLPATPEGPTAEPTGAEWVAAEAKRMKEAGKIPVLKTHFAAELAKRMKVAAAAKRNTPLHPLSAGYISNQLSDWGLWPISKIE